MEDFPIKNATFIGAGKHNAYSKKRGKRMENFISFLLVALAAILWLWAIKDIAFSRFKKPALNTFWLLVIFFFPIIGPIVSFQLKERLTNKEKRRFQPDFNR